jgi:hypothetical protein
MAVHTTVKRCLAGKKPRALPGGVPKKIRAQYLSEKGGVFPKIPIKRKADFEKIYWAGLSDLLNVSFYMASEYLNKENHASGLHRAKRNMEFIEKHYQIIAPILRRRAKDPAFMPFRIHAEEIVPALRKLLFEFEANPSEAKAKKIMRLVLDTRKHRNRILKEAMKTGINLVENKLGIARELGVQNRSAEKKG